ncbi:PHP domain-containing protein [Cellulophaga sp. BC115SP]|uniref:PHP domain-containing protein n=1 Tax=Cellulophaga sp. BC115SP TaxID=2683263 RepID=UPI001411C604|nr:PHP domain-containing protein [Cellulophaga sp. BC115SP]NBB30866.1 DNA polymerase/3'-5' exonuclease PolX [Cellulophaga sp. BC115SP]
MNNQDILDILELTVKLLELHDENEFKIKNLSFAVRALDKATEDFITTPIAQLAAIQGVGKSTASKIEEIRTTGQLAELNELLNKTPEGILEMFKIKGIGPKKVRMIWQELGITDTRELLLACENGEVAKLKGFGDKIQESIKQSILYNQSNSGKLRMEKGQEIADFILDILEPVFEHVQIVGDIRRKNEVVESIQLVVGHDQPWEVQQLLNATPTLQQNEKDSSPFTWRGNIEGKLIPIEVIICPEKQFINQSFIFSASPKHLAKHHLYQTVQNQSFDSEEDIYAKVGIPYIIPEMREGAFEFDWIQKHHNDQLVTWDSLKGILHNHSTYSDGKNTLAEMANYCRELGFEYLGIADHSKTASYARGLNEVRVAEQHAEIDQLNAQYTLGDKPFKILKGIESDILGDGSLDYDEEVLKSFDYIVASVHQNLKMTEEKAMYRLIKAIENPYTTILGHPTGRLILSRAGYPVDHYKLIDACAANGVVIEINASPYRLDLDWRYIQYALEKNVKLSINPDAHEKEGYFDMHFGVANARKGGLTADMTFNAMSISEMEAYLRGRKK